MSAKFKQSRQRGQNQDRKIWQRNLTVLEQYHPGLAHEIKALMATDRQEAIYSVESSRVGAPTLRLQRAGRGAIYLHSRYDPLTEAAQWADHAATEDWHAGVIFGIGLAYHIDELVTRFPERPLLVISPDLASLVTLLQSRDVCQLLCHASLQWLIGNDVQKLSIQIFYQHLQKHLLIGQVGFFAWPAMGRQWADLWQQVQAQIGQVSQQALVNLATYRRFNQSWLNNVLRNLPIGIKDPDIGRLSPIFAGKPAILVAAGPSLKKNIHLLAHAKDKALIIAVGSAFEAVLASGIEPDAVSSFEAGPNNYFLFSGHATENLVLFYGGTIYPRVLQEYRGPRFGLTLDSAPYEPWLFAQLGLDRKQCDSGPSIANMTWDLLRQFGCNPIIFIGQDLAFGENNAFYAPGVSAADREKSIYQGRMKQNQEVFPIIEDIEGRPVRTTEQWLAMKIWFEQHIALRGGKQTYIDATEGGARIAGTQVMSLQAVIDRYCTEAFYPSDQIRQAHADHQATLDEQRLDAAMSRVLQGVAESLQEIYDHSMMGLQQLTELRKQVDSDQFSSADLKNYAKQLSSLDRKISENSIYQQFLRPSLVDVVTILELLITRLEKETDTLAKGKQLFELYLGFFSSVQQMAKETHQTVVAVQSSSGTGTPDSFKAEIHEVRLVCQEAMNLLAQWDTVGSTSAGRDHLFDDLLKLKQVVEQGYIYKEFVLDVVLAADGELHPRLLELLKLSQAAQAETGGRGIHHVNFLTSFFTIMLEALVLIERYVTK